LVLLLLPGVPESLVRPRNGARRWISLVMFDLQPSELARVAWCLLMARLLYAGDAHRRLLGLLRPMALTAIAGGLIVVEPDLGTTLLFVPAFVTILIAAGGRIRHLLMFLVPAALIPVLLIGGMLLAPEAGEARLSQVLKPHQVDRIVAYTAQLRGDPRYDDDIGYQAAKALLATASGGVTGLGREGAARAVRLSGLPEAHNDMVFAVLVAQHGALGAVVVLGLYVAFGIGGLLIARSCAHPFGRLVAVGITTMLVSQALVHASMTLGLLPITGITLPLVSYGGSSLVTTWGMIGVLVGLAMTPSGRKQEERWDFAFGTNPS
ncbi:MAG: FtsW/RodA/SpoVE family cell cycle protein, partial [Planctomycetota bacterium]|nr:FtsW/RodA/SpoVE family cell cycle protein [Planctomycetota bacterium]